MIWVVDREQRREDLEEHSRTAVSAEATREDRAIA